MSYRLVRRLNRRKSGQVSYPKMSLAKAGTIAIPLALGDNQADNIINTDGITHL
jgi:hypothetical protein